MSLKGTTVEQQYYKIIDNADIPPEEKEKLLEEMLHDKVKKQELDSALT